MNKRLRAIARLVSDAECVADIGCDHGFLAEILLSEKRAARVIACDISASSLNKAAVLAETKHLAIETRLGDGLTVIDPNEAQIAVIAGMGGLEILRILSDPRRRDGIDRFVVSPHSEMPAFRSGLHSLGLAVMEEKIFNERKHDYFIMRLERGAQNLTPDEKEFGLLIHTPTAEFTAYMNRRIKLIESKIAVFGEISVLIEELSRLRRIVV